MTELPCDGATGVEECGTGRDWVGWTVRVALVVYLAPVLLVVLLIGGVSVVATATCRLLFGTRDASSPARTWRGPIVSSRAGVASRPARDRASRRGSGARS